MICKSCHYYGVKDIDKNGHLIWGCTRGKCVEFTDECTDEFVNQLGFDNVQDFLSFKYGGYGF